MARTRRLALFHLPMLLFFAWILGGATGCISKPVLELHSASITSASPMGVGMTIVLRVNNENSFDVKVQNVRTNVTLAKTYQLPAIVYNPDLWLGAGQSTLVPVPVTIPWAMIPQLLATTAGSSAITYKAMGYADVTAVKMLGIRHDDYPINEEGVMSRGALVAAAGQGVFGPMY